MRHSLHASRLPVGIGARITVTDLGPTGNTSAAAVASLAPARPGPVTGVAIRGAGKRLTIGWHRASGATRYMVTVMVGNRTPVTLFGITAASRVTLVNAAHYLLTGGAVSKITILFGTYANLVILPNGAVVVISPNPKFFTQDLGFVSLEGITYQPGDKLPTTPINLNGNNSSQFADHGSVIPQWYRDGSGTVHIEGAARQTLVGANSNFLGQLPHAAAPLHEVTTVVHANSGTWAQLFILPDGRMFTNSINGGFPSDPAGGARCLVGCGRG